MQRAGKPTDQRHQRNGTHARTQRIRTVPAQPHLIARRRVRLDLLARYRRRFRQLYRPARPWRRQALAAPRSEGRPQATARLHSAALHSGRGQLAHPRVRQLRGCHHHPRRACARLAGARRRRSTHRDRRLAADPRQSGDPAWTRCPSSHCTFFHAIVPPPGRRWIAREPLVQKLIANYFTATAPNELDDIVGPVVAGFANDRQARPTDDHLPPPSDGHDSSTSSGERRTGLLTRTLARASKALGPGRRRGREPRRNPNSLPRATEATATNLCEQHNPMLSPNAEATDPDGGTTRPLGPPPKSSTPALNDLPLNPQVPTCLPLSSASTESQEPRPPTKTSRHRRSGRRVADIPDGLPASPCPGPSPARDTPTAAPPMRPDIGNHGAATARIGQAADYAGSLAADNALRPMQQTKRIGFIRPAPDISGQLLDIDALFTTRADTAHIDPHAIAAWVAFRHHLVESLRAGTHTANGERSPVHLLEVGAFLLWPRSRCLSPTSPASTLSPSNPRCGLPAYSPSIAPTARRTTGTPSPPSPAIRRSPATGLSPSRNSSGPTRRTGLTTLYARAPAGHLRTALPPPALTWRHCAGPHGSFTGAHTLAYRPENAIIFSGLNDGCSPPTRARK